MNNEFPSQSGEAEPAKKSAGESFESGAEDLAAEYLKKEHAALDGVLDGNNREAAHAMEVMTRCAALACAEASEDESKQSAPDKRSLDAY